MRNKAITARAIMNALTLFLSIMLLQTDYWKFATVTMFYSGIWLAMFFDTNADRFFGNGESPSR